MARKTYRYDDYRQGWDIYDYASGAQEFVSVSTVINQLDSINLTSSSRENARRIYSSMISDLAQGVPSQESDSIEEVAQLAHSELTDEELICYACRQMNKLAHFEVSNSSIKEENSESLPTFKSLPRS